MNKVYWFFWGDSPDATFFKYGKGKPSNHWCMFNSKLAAYKHAYKLVLVQDFLEPEEELPEDASIEQYQELFMEYGLNLEDGSSNPEIVEIEVWE